MKIMDFLSPEAIIVDLEATDKKGTRGNGLCAVFSAVFVQLVVLVFVINSLF